MGKESETYNLFASQILVMSVQNHHSQDGKVLQLRPYRRSLGLSVAPCLSPILLSIRFLILVLITKTITMVRLDTTVTVLSRVFFQTRTLEWTTVACAISTLVTKVLPLVMMV
jgi:hypothetical protein